MQEQNTNDTINICITFIENITEANFILENQGTLQLCKRKKTRQLEEKVL